MWLETLQYSPFLAPVAAFVAGLSTFFASCLLPLVPLYISYLTALGLALPVRPHEAGGSTSLWQRLIASLRKLRRPQQNISLTLLSGLFVLGFICTFVVLGLAANRFTLVWGPYRHIIQRLSGLLFIFFGLFSLGFFQQSFLQREWKLDLSGHLTHSRRFNAFLTGIAFAFGWTPCIGPNLALILFWAGRADSVLKGTILLIFFGLGLGLPFFLIGIFSEQLLPYLKKATRLSLALKIVSGSFMILAGTLFLFDRWDLFSFALLNILRLPKFTM